MKKQSILNLVSKQQNLYKSHQKPKIHIKDKFEKIVAMSTQLDDQLENVNKQLNNMKFINNFLLNSKKNIKNNLNRPSSRSSKRNLNDELPTLYRTKEQIESDTISLIQNHMVRRRNLDRP